MLKHWTALAIAAALVGGCGAATPPAGPVSPAYTTLQAEGQQQAPEVTTIFPFLAGLGLSAAQTEAIEALLREQRPALTQEEAQARGERLLTMLSQPTLPTEELRAHFTQATETARQEAAASAALFAGIRSRLTPSQRTRAAANIRRSVEEARQPAEGSGTAPAETSGSAEGEDQPPDLQLTEAQQAAFAALAPEQPPDGSALATFFEDGDQAALRAAMQGPTSVAGQVEKLLAAYASLTLTQRRQLVSHMREQQAQANRTEAES